MTEEPLFRSTHEALVYAFNYAGQQSPKTPMTRLFKSNPGELDIPAGIKPSKGLSGLDGAAQAGMILAEVCRLPDDQHNVIVVRYDKSETICNGCHRPDRSDEWYAAIDALSHCVELEGIHRRVRHEMVEKAVFNRGLGAIQVANQYSLSVRTLQRQHSLIREKYRKLFKAAMISLNNSFYGNKELVA